MTLTELLIASILVGIVMIGAVSVDYAIRRSQQNIAYSNYNAISLHTAMLRLTRDASKITGYHDDYNDANGSESGCTLDNSDPIQNVCFRQNFNGNPNDDIAEDKWVCYAYGADFKLYRCAGIPDGDGHLGLTSPLGTDETCQSYANTNPEFIIELRHRLYYNFLAKKTTLSVGGGRYLLKHIDFELETCGDPSASEDPIKNPCYFLDARVSPLGVSR